MPEMVNEFSVQTQGRTYTWDEESLGHDCDSESHSQWLDENYEFVTTKTVAEIGAALLIDIQRYMDRFVSCFDACRSVYEINGVLITFARLLRDTFAAQASESIIETLLACDSVDERDPVINAVRCSVLRRLGRSECAIRLTDQARMSRALLVSRAAAFCDLGYFTLARQSIYLVNSTRRSADGVDPYAMRVLTRIKATRPDLAQPPQNRDVAIESLRYLGERGIFPTSKWNL